MTGQCKKCNESDNDEMVACDACATWYHFTCVEESPGVANRSFCCPVCLEKRKKGKKGQKGKTANQLGLFANVPGTSNDASSSKSVSSKKSTAAAKDNDPATKSFPSREIDAKSVASSSSRVSESRMQLEFRRMEEELALKEKQLDEERQMREKKLEIEKQFIQRKIQQERELREKELAQEKALLDKQLADQIEFQNRQRELRERFQREKFEILSANLELEGAVGGMLPGVDVAQDNQHMVEAWLNKDGEKTIRATVQGCEASDEAEAKSTSKQRITKKQYVLETPKRHPEITAVPPGATNLKFPTFPQAEDFSERNANDEDDDVSEDDNTLDAPQAVMPAGPSKAQRAARQILSKKLPIFTGKVEEWPLFYSSFVNSTTACGFSNIENLVRLQECLKGVALESVRSRLLLPQAVPQIESCLPRDEIIAGYVSLLDGTILHSVYLQIDPEPQHHPVKLKNAENLSLSSARSRNFDAIVRNLRNLYDEELGQTILALPDCTILGHAPESRGGLEQMKLLITLLLGAAVQCPNKEIFIARIKELDVNTQHAIVEVIKQVTDSQTLVLTQEAVDQLPSDMMCKHIVRLAKERDQYYSKWMSSVILENETMNSSTSKSSLHNSSSSATSSANTPSTSSENNHLAVELADYKSKLRKLRQELEEKSELLMEVKEELDHKCSQYEKLRSESQDWYSEARRAAAYRDEVDVLRERGERADRLEVEVQKLREKLSDAEFYRTRVEELREDNRTLQETKEMLEEQLLRSRKRSDQVMILEAEILKFKQMLNDMSLERDVDKSKLQELIEENVQLQLATKNLMAGPDTAMNLTQSDTEEDVPSNDNSLSEQLTTNAQSRALKLELENRRLLAALDSLKESSFHEKSNKILELEKDKKKLSLRLDQLQENCNRLALQNSELEEVFKGALKENKKLQDALDAKQVTIDKQVNDRDLDRIRQIDLEKQIESLTKDKQRVQNLCDSIQRRTIDLERSIESKTKEVQQLNKRCNEFDTIKKKSYEIEGKVTSLEKENINQGKDLAKYKEILEQKSVELDEAITRIAQKDKEMSQLIKQQEDNVGLEKKVQDLEKENQELLSQAKIQDETILTLKKDLYDGTLAKKRVEQNLERLGLNENDIEKNDLNVESFVEKLCKNPESFKTVREIVLSVGKESTKSADMCVLCHRQEIYTVEKDIEFTNYDEAATLKEVEAKLEQFKSENTALQLTNESLQAENARQKVEVATQSSQITSLNTQHVALQLANSQLAAEKDMLVKQVEAKKQAYESLQHDQVTLQCLHEQLSSEYDSLNNEKELLKISIRDLKTENRDMKEHAMVLEKQLEECRMELSSMKDGITNLANLRAEHSKLKDDFRCLFTNSERLKQEYKNRQEQYRACRTENSRLKLQNTELNGELSNKVEQITNLEIEYTKMNQRCEMLLQMNSSLDIDRRTLMDHVSQLLAQYHELLAHSLEDKQHYHDEEKSFTDRVNNLHRQKEKLEEKIMEHYRKLDSCSPKKKPFALNFVKKVRKAGSDLINRVPNRNRRSWVDESRLTQSQFTLGSESGGNESDNSIEEPNSVASDTNLLQRNSAKRQSLQRKPNNEALNTSLLRGGIRSSLQASRRDDANQSHRNSFPGFDTNTDSLNLGTAGTRRTVYLMDGKASNASNSGSSTPTGAPGLPSSSPPVSLTSPPGSSTSSKNSPNSSQTTSNNNNASGNNDSFLLLNRVSTTTTTLKTTESSSVPQTMIVNPNPSGSPSNSAATTGLNADDPSKKDASNKKPKNEPKSRESAIWYEYGCV